MQNTDNRLAKAWYVKYDCDAYAIGPYRHNTPVTAAKIVEQAIRDFGTPPMEVWPTGPTTETDEYEYTVAPGD